MSIKEARENQEFLIDLNDGKELRPFSNMTDRQMLIEILWRLRKQVESDPVFKVGG